MLRTGIKGIKLVVGMGIIAILSILVLIDITKYITIKSEKNQVILFLPGTVQLLVPELDRS